ncbi:LON peptidase substrate-binding domain-containing protein [uncultured Maribacter sp.]|uniref:LON peptidase substrate-binding domain-containing protein n=1 Tax=uncultured Maribacter sp. TaxID=431308 RepID=UPI0026301C3F|nr:LON peptidase substrate-binding domain-containing protein [uncultured Maribacter sp.]
MRLPMFPLQSIFFPGETVPLHVFERRYIQLIEDCREEAITFGIPVYLDGVINYGVEVQLVEVVNSYQGGEMDVICVARQVFVVNNFQSPANGRLYPTGEVSLIDLDYVSNVDLKKEVIGKIQELYAFMNVAFKPLELGKFNSYVLAHKIGLSFKQEYQLLQMPKEEERLIFIKAHLLGTIEVLKEVDRTKKTIELNGHFKNFDPLDFGEI